jgi:hypothetical protein
MTRSFSGRTGSRVLSVFFLVAVGCGDSRTALHPNDGEADSVSPADSSVGSSLGAPTHHRIAGSACSAERPPGSLDCGCPGMDGGCSCAQGACSQDSDCMAGINGRCQLSRAPFMYVGCSYDTCFSDADCPGKEPCDCRASGSRATQSCVAGSNCRTDSDCGPGGYCSPSQVGALCGCMSTAFCNPDAGGGCYVGGPNGTWTQVPCSCGDSCGHGYFCHTPQDTCVNDSDCPDGNTCNFDLPSQTWTCTFCWPVP